MFYKVEKKADGWYVAGERFASQGAATTRLLALLSGKAAPRAAASKPAATKKVASKPAAPRAAASRAEATAGVTRASLDKALRRYDIFLTYFEKDKGDFVVDAVYFESGIPRILILAAEAGPEEADEWDYAWDKLDEGTHVRVTRKGGKVTYRGDYRGTQRQSASAMADIIAGLNAAISGDYVL